MMSQKKVRVFGLKTLFLKRFTVRSTTRTLITDKNDHSVFIAIILLVTCWVHRWRPVGYNQVLELGPSGLNGQNLGLNDTLNDIFI
jgi:hypothetical protein